MKRFKTVEDYIENHTDSREILIALREIILSTELKEEVKWGAPTYTFLNKNLVGLGAFKSYVGIWFFQGALLKDTKKVLINAQEGKTKAMRQWRFNSLEDIDTELLIDYIKETIQNQKEGKEIKPDKNKPLIIPDELQAALKKNTEAANKFELLSLSCKREYSEYIIEAKRPETKIKRIEKILPMIIESIGLNDKYR